MMRLECLLLVVLLCAVVARSGAETGVPPGVRDVGFDQHPGAAIDAGLVFRDETGRSVRLGDYLGTRPLLLVPAYYGCPMLCSLVIGGVVSALRALPFDAGKEFDVLVVSFDPHESPPQAAEKKTAVLADYRRPGAAPGWHLLTGEAEPVAALMRTIGFRYAWDDAHRQWAHAAGLVVLTPDGRIARYFFGVEFAPRDLRLALAEASAGRIGTVVDQLLLFCFHYDPATGRYSRLALGAVRAGGVLTLGALAVFVWVSVRRERRRPGQSLAGEA